MIEAGLNEFFLIGALSNSISIINIDAIINKCVLIENGKEYFVSLCNELNVHDWKYIKKLCLF